MFQFKGRAMKKIHILSALLTLSCVMFLLDGCNNASDSMPESDNSSGLPVVTVSCDNYQPFSYIDTNGEVTGIDVELAKEAFGRMGYEPEFTIINWEEKKDLLNNGDGIPDYKKMISVNKRDLSSEAKSLIRVSESVETIKWRLE